MFEEKRSSPRVSTHIPLELMLTGEHQQHFGYIENISAGGMGVVSLEFFVPGTQISSGFYLPHMTERVRPIASVVHSQKGADMIYYHGLRFDYLVDGDRRSLNDFLSQAVDKVETI